MWDADGNGCGLDGKPTANYPYLYFPMINITEVQEATDDPKAKIK
jgi:hypothetical protein